MPQLSPMPWMILSLSPLLMMTMMMAKNKTQSSPFKKTYFKKFSTMKWLW